MRSRSAWLVFALLALLLGMLCYALAGTDALPAYLGGLLAGVAALRLASRK